MAISAFGFKPTKDVVNNAFVAREYKVADNYGTALAAGDPVRLENGFLVRAAAGENIDGIFVQARWVDNTTKGVRIDAYLPANTISAGMPDGQLNTPEATILPVTETGTFVVKSDEAIAATDLSKYAAMLAGTASDVRRQSGFQLDGSTINATATGLDVRVLRIVDATEDLYEVEFLNF